MFGLQPAHLVIILFVAILLFVPSRIPELARSMKKMVAEFRKETSRPSNTTPPTQDSTDTPRKQK